MLGRGRKLVAILAFAPANPLAYPTDARPPAKVAGSVTIAGMPLRYACSKCPTPLPIDGTMQHPNWKLASWTSPFVDIEGDVKPRPHFLTRAKMLWDDDYFYIGAELEEPHLWATLTEHDSVIFHDNDFEVFIDPDGDALRYFEFEMNALNTTWDLYLAKPYRDGGDADNAWETDARTAVQLRGSLNDPRDLDEGWTLEIAFPWACFAEHAGMPCPPNVGDTWRVNFSRVQWLLEDADGRVVNDLEVQIGRGPYRKKPGHPEFNWVWSPQGVIDMHQPERGGYAQFSEQKPATVAF